MNPSIIIILTWCSISVIESNWILRKNSTSISFGLRQNECLSFYQRSEFGYQVLEYCLRLTESDPDVMKFDFINNYEQKFTFEELVKLNITANDLLTWYIPLDTVEQYQFYLDHSKTNEHLSKTVVYKCKHLWIGEQCQYTFSTKPIESLMNIMEDISLIQDQVTCFNRINCTRNGQQICLDWSDICDGEIDCTNTGEDEQNCSQLELNECDENYYRCRNGLCITKEVDIHRRWGCQYDNDVSYWAEFEVSNDYDYSIVSGLRLMWEIDPLTLEFLHSTYRIYERINVRLHTLTIRKSLSEECWMILACLTKARQYVNKTTCESFLETNDIFHYLNFCEPITLFPEEPVISSHIYLLFETRNISKSYINQFLRPTYICFDPNICPHLPFIFIHQNRSCQSLHTLGIKYIANLVYQNLGWIIDDVRKAFEICLMPPIEYHPTSMSLLYCCQNSSRCISKHRVLDGFSDCPMSDDETAFELSCTIQHRVQYYCDNRITCRALLLGDTNFDCVNPMRQFEDLRFYEICDRTEHIQPILIDGKNHTDETDCEEWDCNNAYTRCDQHWACPNGEDEFNCPGRRSLCPKGTHECLSIVNLTIICLEGGRVSNQIIDCIGGTDERDICKKTFYFATTYNSFLCSNENKCLSKDSLCDGISHCSSNDDELFCQGLPNPVFCKGVEYSPKNAILNHICKSVTINQNIFVRNHSQNRLPSSKSQAQSLVKQQETYLYSIPLRGYSIVKTWRYCVQGLQAFIRVSQQEYRSVCFCSLQLYGFHCQHQLERISVHAKLLVFQNVPVVSLLINLIDDDDEQQLIYSYHFATLTSNRICENIVQANLLFPTHPKNFSKNYSVRIDAFDRGSLQYLTSWYYTIPFPFLPLYSLVVHLAIHFYPVSSSKLCSPPCIHGNCIEYTNIAKHYCRCHPGWTGIQCTIPLDRNFCESGSLSVGFNGYHPICLCPVNVFGNRCNIKVTCQNNTCPENSTCVVLTRDSGEYKTSCLCKNDWSGHTSPLTLNTLHISLELIPHSTYAVVYYTHIRAPPVDNIVPTFYVIPYNIEPYQTSIQLTSDRYFTLVVVILGSNMYLINNLGENTVESLSLSILPSQQCPPVEDLLSTHIISLPRIQRVKHYHHICRIHRMLNCFYDEYFVCYCTEGRATDCLHLDRNSTCNHKLYCQNDAKCIQSSLPCAFKTICICHDCFFGDRCQFYAKGVSLTLEDILRYHIKPGDSLQNQSKPVKVVFVLTLLMFVVGIINSVCSLLTFSTQDARKVGAGLYLLASSISSFLTVSMLTVKFWFVFVTHANLSMSTTSMLIGCKSIEFLLKVCLCTDSWLNASVAIERYDNIRQGSGFTAKSSRKIAKRVIRILPVLISASLIHEPLHRNLFKDQAKDRYWCLLGYSKEINGYNRFILFFHILVPFVANVLSAILIILKGAEKRSAARKQQKYTTHLINQIKVHKHLIISPLIIVVLSIPRLIITLLSRCVNTNQDSWLLIAGYFISFIPSVIVFVIFVLPSTLYKKQFRQSVHHIRRLALRR